MSGYYVDLQTATEENDNFRKVLFTAPHSQLVVMTLKGGEDIGSERHPNLDQFICVASGRARAVLDGDQYILDPGSAVVVPAGTEHNIINSSPTESLRLFTVYSPPAHPDGTINHTKKDAVAYERQHNES
jgi:mannose-6-phosphate isomerase-like protein (cupin superfamily)